MNETDSNLLFGAQALAEKLIDAEQFAQACLLWRQAARTSLAEVLIAQGWIKPEARARIEALVSAKTAPGADATQLFTKPPLAASGATVDFSAEPTFRWSAQDEPASLDPSEFQKLLASGARYSQERLHAEGGIGRIWAAQDGQLKREVALKTLRPEFVGHARVRARFLQEAQITGQLEHPGIVPVYELGAHVDSGQIFYAMRLVRGRTLAEAAKEFHRQRLAGDADPLAFVSLLSAFVAVCNTVAYAHSKGVIHRDLKGENVLLGDFGEVLLLDWGVAKLLGQADEPLGGQLSGEAAADRTIYGDVIGTPAYMAPEQAEGRLELINERTDLYGLGAILYEILTGQPPFVGSNTIEVLHKVARDEPLAPRDAWADVPAGLEVICRQALAKDPGARHDSATALGQQVQAWQETERRKAQEALLRQGELLQSVLDNMSESLVAVDALGQLILSNPAADRLLDLSAHDRDLPSALAGVSIFLSDGVTPCDLRRLPIYRALSGEPIDDEELFCACGADQGGRWFCANARPLKQTDGAIYGAVMVLRDVTERKRFEVQLRRSKERFELAVQGSQDGLWDWDLETNEVFYSPRWKSILGYADDEIAHHLDEWDQRLHPDEREQVLAANYAHINGTTSHYEYEYRLRHKDGTFRWILARGVALRDAQGKAFRMAGSHVDITAWKELEARLQRCEAERQALLDAARARQT